MATTFSAEELSAETGVSVDRIHWIAAIGVIRPREPGRFTAADGFRAKMLDALLESGISREQLETAARIGSLHLEHIDDYILFEPSSRSDRTFADFLSGFGDRGALIPAVYQVLGIPQPDPDAHLPLAEEELVGDFVEAWSLAPEDRTLIRAARMVAEGTRLAALGWSDLFDEQVSGPARERLYRGELDRFPPEVGKAAARLFRLIPRVMTWLEQRYVEQLVVAGIVEGFEEFLSTRGLAPAPSPTQPPAVVFVDLSGYTHLTEEQGDETAVRASVLLQERAEAIAVKEEGRLVKVLGDGAMLSFRDPSRAVSATVQLVRELTDDLGVPAHAGINAGPVIQRDLDLFGRTVNLASRIAGRAAPGEVIASSEVAGLAGDGFRFEPLSRVTLKGIDQPVTLYRVERAERP
ncbi:MAG TPA: adenylate/guanylate cyclase domain-containing protein [Actinomycetota bacterium]|nr:adenylate/guanylate cyclase domain-containing protein [Actinomycetota bacterium]